MTRLYLSLGTNLGDRQHNLCAAVTFINDRIGTVEACSSIIETEPWGFTSSNAFLNQAVSVQTLFEPLEVLHKLQEIEREMGRNEKSYNGIYKDRIIDIDILLYGNSVLNTAELVLPHPLMTQRKFVMQPLSELAPDLVHPIYGKTISQLFESLDEKK